MAISAESANSKPPADAKCNAGPIASKASLALNPAIPRNFTPPATCFAVHSVDAPRSFTFFPRASKSALLPDVTALTSDIAFSNDFAFAIGKKAAAARLAPIFPNCMPTLIILSDTFFTEISLAFTLSSAELSFLAPSAPSVPTLAALVARALALLLAAFSCSPT